MMWVFVQDYQDPTRWREMSAADEEGEIYELPPPPKVRIHRTIVILLS
jgi:hypothetical protein